MGPRASGDPLVVGTETSCEEAGVALVRGDELLVDATASSMDEPARYGGLLPEVASGAHLEVMIPTIQKALGEADGTQRVAGLGLAAGDQVHLARERPVGEAAEGGEGRPGGGPSAWRPRRSPAPTRPRSTVRSRGRAPRRPR